MQQSILEKFHPAVRSWFQNSFGTPSPPQLQGWPSISNGNNTLIVAPTGSGKTLAAFLWCINHLVEEYSSAVAPDPPLRTHRQRNKIVASPGPPGVRVLYISPLKALNNDIHRNLEIPLKGIAAEAHARGISLPPLRKAVRTGDTTQSERTAMLKHPPDILITTPESLYLMLSSDKARTIFHTVQYVIVDEIHAISNNKRGVHLSVTLERLEELVKNTRGAHAPTFVRIGLSATQKPVEDVARFLGGFDIKDTTSTPRPVTIVDAGYKKQVDLKVICAPADFTDMVTGSVWNAVYPQLLEIILRHRSTLIFVNNRRLAERLSAKLNEMLEGETNTLALYSVPVFTESNVRKETTAPFKVFSYHGSMSRTVREQLESDLKSGKLRALVTTSALELGIDIGSVDLVVQIQSPKGIARGLQRVGRSGHLVSAESKGRIFVTHREDLLESAVVAKAMSEHAIEKTFIPKNCLDVLAQQMVAMVGVEDWNVDELYDLVRRSYCYHTLTEKVFTGVLEMIGGRFANEAFRELRARVVWDKLHNRLTSLPGSSTLALTNAGTIPDRGYYGVYLEDRKTKVGEVDEEFIYESRTGDTFILGTNVWRMIDIDANKVIVQPAPGHPARMPFWRGEMIGRTYELCLKLGEFIEHLARLSDTSPSNTDAEMRSWLTNHYPVDEHSLRNICDYIREQQSATRLVPSHRTIVVEGFRDEVGDPRVLVHSRFGKSVNGLLGLVLLHHLQQRLGIEVQMLYNDDGILFRCSDVERLPLDILTTFAIEHAEQIILEQLPSSPLFGALFRQNAERALLLPKGNPGKRRPFFLQRLKAADLLQIVKQYGDFPIVIETMRECLNDVLDIRHCKEVLAHIEKGEIHIHTVQTDFPSPFASSLLFDFTMVYMYEWDNPKSAAKEQFAQLNREILAEVVQLDAVKTVVRNDAIRKVTEQLQFTSSTRKARSAAELMDIVLRLGELTESEILERCEKSEFRDELLAQGILSSVILGKKHYFVLTEELPLYSPFSVAPSLTPSETTAFGRKEALQYVILRMLRSHGPLTTGDIADRYSLSGAECEQLLHDAAATENIVHGLFTKESIEQQWCYRPNLERIHRASISILRKEIRPATIADFTQLLQHWQHRHPQTWVQGEEGVRTVIDMMQGYSLPAELWESEIVRPRLQHYTGAMLRSVASRGEIVCLGTHPGKSQWVVRGEGAAFAGEKEMSLEHLPAPSLRLYDYLKENGASFLSDIRTGLNLSLPALNRSLSDLFWRGLITNDEVDEVLNVKRYRSSDDDDRDDRFHVPDERFEIVNPRRNPLRISAMRGVRHALKNVPGWHGRWSLVHLRSLLGPTISEAERVQRQAEQLLLRYGIVAREVAKREENLLPWSLLAMHFQRMEMRGEIRRGYFVEGLSGMQFALPEAVGMLEGIKHEKNIREEPSVVNSCDPSNPYGTGVEMTGSLTVPERITRAAANYVIFDKGHPILWLEGYGTRIYYTDDLSASLLQNGLLQFIQHLRSTQPQLNDITVEYCNAMRPGDSTAAETLRAAGFYRDKVQTMRLELR